MSLWIAREHFWSKKRSMEWGRDTLSFNNVIAHLLMPSRWTVTQNASMGKELSAWMGTT